MGEEKVTTAHLDSVAELLSSKMDAGFSGVHARMGRFEDEVRPVLLQQAGDIAVLKHQAAQAERAANQATAHVQNTKKNTRNRATAWGAGAAGFVYFVIEFVKVLKPLVVGH